MKHLPFSSRHAFYSLLYVILQFIPGFVSATGPRVVCTTTFIADMAQNIAGEYAEVISLMPLGGDPHIYEPVPGDAKKIAEADIILKNGLTLEGWLNEMIDNSGTNAYVVTISDGVKPIHSALHENAFDPHAWMDPQNALIYIANIRDALIRIAPAHAAEYRKNYETYREKLQILDDYVTAQILRIPPEHRVLATSHDAFRYYGNHYGLQVVSILGTSTDAEARIEDYNFLVSLIKKYKVPAIFIESTINPKLLLQLAEDLGIKIGGKLYADSLGDTESGADSYEKMIRQNTDLIVAGLMRDGAIKSEEKSLSFLFVILALFILSFSVVVVKLKNPSKTDLSWENYHVEIRGLSVTYDRKTAVSNIFIDIEPGYVYGLIGGNGSGKSTLFKSILGLVEADSGTVSINGETVDSVRKYISYIPQKEEIDWTFPATVFDVVLLGRYPHREVFDRLRPEDRKKAENALIQLGIYDLKDKQIGELSGGQQQRAFIARALCQEAELYLFDEPFVGVDITTENKIIEIVKGLAAQGKLVVIIHHDLAKVREYFDRLIMINQRIIAIGDTEEVFTDENIKKTYGGRLTILQKTETIL
ncbi:MAG: zinc ABC transporter substrate-binding protein [Bacteroidia bacterium]